MIEKGAFNFVFQVGLLLFNLIKMILAVFYCSYKIILSESDSMMKSVLNKETSIKLFYGCEYGTPSSVTSPYSYYGIMKLEAFVLSQALLASLQTYWRSTTKFPVNTQTLEGAN